MRTGLMIFALACCTISMLGQRSTAAIRSLMETQEEAWNSGDLEAFMAPYWNSDSLLFIGSRGLSYGWQTTLDNYRKSYPDASAMGQLTFSNLHFDSINRKTVFVVGKWHLSRAAGDLEGHYSLIWKKRKGKWFIVADHSS